MDSNVKILTDAGRSIVAKFLEDKPHKGLFVCSEGFLDQEEGVPVSDLYALKWFEEEGGKFSTILN